METDSIVHSKQLSISNIKKSDFYREGKSYAFGAVGQLCYAEFF